LKVYTNWDINVMQRPPYPPLEELMNFFKRSPRNDPGVFVFDN